MAETTPQRPCNEAWSNSVDCLRHQRPVIACADRGSKTRTHRELPFREPRLCCVSVFPARSPLSHSRGLALTRSRTFLRGQTYPRNRTDAWSSCRDCQRSFSRLINRANVAPPQPARARTQVAAMKGSAWRLRRLEGPAARWPRKAMDTRPSLRGSGQGPRRSRRRRGSHLLRPAA